MAARIDPAKVTLLKEFIKLCKAKPQFLHLPDLEFFKDWLASMGATIPPPPEPEAPPEDKDEDEPSAAQEASPPPSPAPHTNGTGGSGSDQQHKAKEAAPEQVEEEMGSEESDLELDMEGVITPDEDPQQEMGDQSIEVTEEMVEKAQDERTQGTMMAAEGDMDSALEHYTAAILSNPKSAPLYAKRASIFVKVKRPNAAIRDCNMSVQLNPDSAQGYKWRGLAHRLLGHWEEAAKDLQTACKLDYDEHANDVLKEIQPKAQRIHEHNLKKERKKRERELEARKRRVKEAREQERKEREAREKAEQEAKHHFHPGAGMGGRMPGGMPGGMGGGMGAGMPGGMGGGMPGGMGGGMPGGMGGGMPGGMGGGMPGGMGGGMPGGMGGGMPGGMGGGMPGMFGMESVLSDPEVLSLMQEPDVMAAFADIQQNPANISKHQNNPKVMKVMEKLAAKFDSMPRGGGAGGGGAGGAGPTGAGPF